MISETSLTSPKQTTLLITSFLDILLHENEATNRSFPEASAPSNSVEQTKRKCDWCQQSDVTDRTPRLAHSNEAGDEKQFCSETCFSHFRRDMYKKQKVSFDEISREFTKISRDFARFNVVKLLVGV